jgi:hypothetical protein
MPSHKIGRSRTQAAAVLRREGDYWTVVYEATVVRLKDAKGLRYLEPLLRHPGRVFHVTELIDLVENGGVLRARSCRDDLAIIERARKAVTNRIRATIARVGAVHAGLGRHLDNAVRTGAQCNYRPDRPTRWGR